MPINSLRNDALPVAQVDTLPVGGTPTVGQIFSVTINRKTVSYTTISTDTTLTIIAASIAAALTTAAQTITEFLEIAWTSSVANVIATGPADGTTFTISGTSATGGGTPTFTDSTTTAALGFLHADDPANWSLNRLPAGGVATPVLTSAVALAGGTLVNGTPYFWIITGINAIGETVKSNQVTFTPSGGNLSATLTWPAVVGATGYKIYRSTTTNVYTTPALVASVGVVTTYADTGTAVGVGAPPGVSTATGDDVYLTGTTQGLKYGLAALGYLAFNSLHIDSTFTGPVGLPDINPTGYVEYRPKYWTCAPLTVYYGENNGTGSGLVRIDKGSASAVAWIIYQTGSPSTNGQGALQIIGANAGDTMVITSGFVSGGVGAGNTFQLSTLKTGYLNSPATDVTIYFGTTAVLGTISQNGGTLYCPSNVTALTMSDGIFYLEESATLGTFLGYGGTLFDMSNGLITSLTVDSGCTVDKSSDGRAQTITNATFRNGSTFLDPNNSVAFTNPFLVDGTLNQNAQSFVKLDLGNGFHLQKS